MKDFEQGPPVEAPVSIRILGKNLDTLRMLAAEAEMMMKSTEGAIYVKNDVGILKSDLKLKINTDKSRSLGIQTADIDKTVRLAVAGLELGQYTNDKGDDYNILLNAPKTKFASLSTFNDIYINNAAGTPVSLKQVSELEFESSPTVIKHLDKKRYVTVSAFNQETVLAEKIVKDFLAKAKDLRLPDGYSLELAGEAESQKEAFGGGFMTVVISTIFLFIMVLLLEFKTFKSTSDCFIGNSIGCDWWCFNVMDCRLSNVVCGYYWFHRLGGYRGKEFHFTR